MFEGFTFIERFLSCTAIVLCVAVALWGALAILLDNRENLHRAIMAGGERLLEKIEAFDAYICDTDDDSGIADWADMEKAARTRMTNGRYRG